MCDWGIPLPLTTLSVFMKIGEICAQIPLRVRLRGRFLLTKELEVRAEERMRAGKMGKQVERCKVQQTTGRHRLASSTMEIGVRVPSFGNSNSSPSFWEGV